MVANRLRSGGRVLVSAVNWAEAAGKLRQYGMSPVLVRHALAAADAEIIPFAEPDADAVARLTQQTLALGLSLGDRAWIVLAIAVGAPAVTADRLWSRLANGRCRIWWSNGSADARRLRTTTAVNGITPTAAPATREAA